MVFRRFATFALAALALTTASLVAASPGDTPAEADALASIDADGYSVVVNDGSSKVGVEAFIVVTVTAKPGYKVNKKYPHKIKLDEAPDGVEYPKPVLKKDDAELENKSLTFRIPVKANKAGSYDVSGKLKISVCNDKSCLIKKEHVTAKLNAS